VELAYQATLTAGQQAEVSQDSLAAAPNFDVAAVPRIYLFERQIVYDDGEAFVQELLDEGGDAAVDDAFGEPPTTTEQIQEPETYLAGRPPDPVPVPGADGPSVGEGIVGQALLDLLTEIGRPEGTEVAEWDGDRYVLWADGGEVCIRLDVVGDVEALADGLEDWADEVDAEVSVEGDRLSAQNCA
jgi:hypothetical protein